MYAWQGISPPIEDGFFTCYHTKMTTAIIIGVVTVIAVPFFYIIHQDLKEYADSLAKKDEKKITQDET